MSLPRLYAILDVDLCCTLSLDPLSVLTAFLDGGATLLQLRYKSGSSSAYLDMAAAVTERAHSAAARVIINDRADIAAMAAADGVHVGQDDVPVDAARHIVGLNGLVGLSTHDEAQIEAGLRTTATYLAVGPIYSTETKATGYSARGLELVRRAAASGRPVVAIGGITRERAPEVIAAGASSVAVISALLSGDPERSVRAFVAALAAEP
jgi:thiamine-phosphate pyrophosphorylase